MWLGIGFGNNKMLNTDLMVFQAKDNGVVTSMYATKYGPPTADAKQDFTWTMSKLPDGTYDFKVQRPLAPSGSTNFAITLDKEFPMIWAELSTSAELN